jgi:hypothetical protein
MTPRRFAVALVVLLVCALPASADKTWTIKSLTAGDFRLVHAETDALGIVKMCGTYDLKDASGAVAVSSRTHCLVLTPTQKGAFVIFVRDTIGLILSANQAEGLEP